jgi:hypothetical protein
MCRVADLMNAATEHCIDGKDDLSDWIRLNYAKEWENIEKDGESRNRYQAPFRIFQ